MQFADQPITPVSSASFLRFLHRALPLERRFLPLLRCYQEDPGLLSVPWGEFQLHFPGSWLPGASDAVYKKPRNNNPEFFDLLAPITATLDWGSIVDVGAALGVYILNFRAITDRPIIAYEPSPLPFALAEYNVRANSLVDVRIRNVACGNSAGWVQLAAGINSAIVPDKRGAASAFDASDDVLENSVSVPLVRLDDDLRASGPVSLLKIDCEGFEYQVLSGSAEVIEKYHPIIFLELHPKQIDAYGHSLAEVCEFLTGEYDLEFWDFDSSERSPHSVVRFLGRYRRNGCRYSDRHAMMEAASHSSGPSQIFLLARPR
ncbi:MAG TPA: FkbM family methyltransferase [Candidatus Binatia bacterium]